MCTAPKAPAPLPEPEIVKTAVKADASVQKANVKNRNGFRGLISEDIKTGNNGLNEEVVASKKKLLGE